jgi:hypothetical protein
VNKILGDLSVRSVVWVEKNFLKLCEGGARFLFRAVTICFEEPSVWLRTGRPGDRGSIPGRGMGFFL